MNGPRSVVVSGLVALLIALSAVALISLSGVPAIRLPLTSSGPSTLTPSGATSTTTGPRPETATSSNTTGPSQTSAGQGVLSVLLTDPPHVPIGVTSVYVYYNDLAVHGSNGWTTLKSSGDIDFLATVNVGETLASASMPAGSYDSVNLIVSSVLVTYNSVNYPAFVEGGGQLNVKIEGSVIVASSQATATIIEISPTVVNVGSSSVPKFILWSEARGFPVPADQVNASLEVEGNRLSLSGMGWWDSDKAASNASLSVSSLTLSANSLGLTVSNVGAAGTYLKLVVISGINPLAGVGGGAAVPAAMTGSAVFTVLSNGSLVQFLPVLSMGTPQMTGANQSLVFDALYKAGYNLPGGGKVHLTYTGPIELSFGLFVLPPGVKNGSTYWVTVIGDDAVTTTQVTAS